jgi:hypothetical protein
MTSNEYERVTKAIQQAVFEQVEGAGVKRVGHGLRNKVKGQSGYAHQIDVSVENDRDLLLIECKMWKDPVKVPAFLAFLARIVDISPAQSSRKIHASLVTTKGFQRGVVQLANYYRNYYDIQLDKVGSAAEFAMKYKQLFAIGVQDDLNQWGDSVETHLN